MGRLGLAGGLVSSSSSESKSPSSSESLSASFFFFTYSRARENQIRERMVKVLDTSVAFFMMIWVEDGVSIKLSNPSASLGNGILFVPL